MPGGEAPRGYSRQSHQFADPLVAWLAGNLLPRLSLDEQAEVADVARPNHETRELCDARRPSGAASSITIRLNPDLERRACSLRAPQ